MLRDLDAGRDSLRQPVVRGRRGGHGHGHDALWGRVCVAGRFFVRVVEFLAPLGAWFCLVKGLGRLARDGMLTSST
jgi:hypothetical protein